MNRFLHAATILGISAVTQPVLAQYEEIPEDLLVAGEIMVKSFTEDAVIGVVQDMEDILGPGMVSIIRSQDILDLYTIGTPVVIPVDASTQLREILDDAVSEGVLGWSEPNLVVENVGGQTGSLWVSGLGIDRNGYDEQFAVDLLDLDIAHQSSTGRGVLVAVVDTGIDEEHEALHPRVSPFGMSLLAGYLTPYDESSPDPNSMNVLRGHGTFVAGLISIVAPHARLLPIRVLDSDGQGSTEVAAAGIVEAVQRGAHVVTLAFGTPQQSQTLNSAIQFATQSGVIVLAAAGNSGEVGCFYPASNPAVFNVAASDHRDNLDPISSWCDSVDACGPGSMLVKGGIVDPDASVIGPFPDDTSNSEYKAGRGTSFAVGFAAGIAALVRSQHPEWPNESVPLTSIPAKIEARMEDLIFNEVIQLPAATGVRARISALVATASGPDAPSPGDVNGDSCVDAADLGLVLAAFGQPLQSPGLHLVDIDGDFEVGPSDLGLLLALWSSCR